VLSAIVAPAAPRISISSSLSCLRDVVELGGCTIISLMYNCADRDVPIDIIVSMSKYFFINVVF
jgi:hypothetical protein